MQQLDTNIKEVASESTGSKRTVPLTVSDGVYGTNTTYDWLYYTYEPSNGLDLGGTRGDIRVESGLKFADYFNWYMPGSVAAPTWKNVSGQWAITDSTYAGQNGAAYHNVSGALQNWQLSATITNLYASATGEIFALPTNPESLVGYWTFDEGSGGNAYDYSGRNNTGTLNMNTTGNATSGWNSTDCKYGSCLKFDGMNDYVSVANSGSLNITNALTIALWVKFNSIAPSAGFLAKGYGSISNYQFGTGESGTQLRFRWNDTNNIINSPNHNYKADEWHYVTVTVDTVNHILRFYSDGSQLGSDVSFPSVLIANSEPLKIGLSADTYFNGTIDEVMTFNRSLSASEVATLYETSAKKLLATGTQGITSAANVSIVLSSPSGQTSFDDVTVSSGSADITLIVPYNGIEINGSMRAARGQQLIEITNMGIDATSDKQILQIKDV